MAAVGSEDWQTGHLNCLQLLGVNVVVQRDEILLHITIKGFSTSVMLIFDEMSHR